MNDREIDKIGDPAFSRSIEPLKRLRSCKWPIIGFDTEYTSKSNTLLCFTLWHDDRGVFVEVKPGKRLTPKWLWTECARLLHDAPSDALLVTYFSLAELQFLPVVAEGVRIREYAGGSLDCDFYPGGGHGLHIFDLARWFTRQSLAKAATALGLEPKEKQDVTKVTRAHLRSRQFRSYALHDAKLCYDGIQKLRYMFMDTTGIDPIIAKTPANASAQAFRRMKIRRKYFCDNNRVRYVALRCAWGGRAEVFHRGRLTDEHTEWDFASAYPRSAIALGEMPIQGSWSPVRSLSRKGLRGGFIHCLFRFPSGERYPCLPVEASGCMIYPLEGETWCTIHEARKAVEFGAKIEILEAWGYSKGTPALSQYLKWTLDEREKAIGAGQVLYKLLGNALIGKFAQRVSKIPIDEYYRLAEELDVYLDELFELNSEELSALGAVEHIAVGSVFMPEWNALITGYTRAALADMVRSGQAVYCHTDSVWTKRRPKCDMLPFDAKVSGKVTIVRTRFAGIGDRFTAKAVKDKTAHVAHHSVWNLIAGCQMVNKFDGEDFVRTYPIRRPLKFREAVKSGRTPGRWVQEWRKASTLWDGKRRLLPDGSTKPWKSLDDYERNRA